MSGKDLASGEGLSRILAAKGHALMGLRRYQRALTYYQKALEIAAGDDSVWLGQAEALCQLGRFEEALPSLTQARELKDEAQTSLGIGYCLLALERYSEAEEEFSALVSKRSRDPQVFCGLGMAQYAMGDRKQGRTHLERFVEMAGPEHKDLLQAAREMLGIL